jgi:hypothetical protein
VRNEIHANQFLFYLSLLIERNEGFIYSTLFREGRKQKKYSEKKKEKRKIGKREANQWEVGGLKRKRATMVKKIGWKVVKKVGKNYNLC